ncbi:MAG: DUF5777 family beta-barrel protein [Balneolaceae bacterium]
MNLHQLLIRIPILLVLALLIPAESLFAQLERRLAETDGPVELTFLAPRNINIQTVEGLARGELHLSILHNFGEVSTGIENFWGLDSGANVRISLEYGFSDHVSLGIGRTRVNKFVDLTGRIALLKQTKSNSVPVSISILPSLGINTTNYQFLQQNYTFQDRLAYAVSLPVAHKFNEKLSLQISPMAAYFSRTGPELNIADPENDFWYSAAFAGRYLVSNRTAVTFQYLPPLSDAEDLTYNFAIGIDIDTGGHVFQIFFSTSPALNDHYLIASPNGSFPDREFRLGFNVNRLFSLVQ